MFKEKMKKFWNKHKGVIITAGISIGAGLCYLAIAETKKELKELPEKFAAELLDETNGVDNLKCLVDGEWKPIYENGDETKIYSYAFENDQVKEEFRELGYTIVEEA